ncbi:MAG TPA: hypothetical protein VMV33_17470 [Rhodocyclaceae bacterium]|nr:hypothetical protein [Rhodocyclaceae bacterium]
MRFYTPPPLHTEPPLHPHAQTLQNVEHACYAVAILRASFAPERTAVYRRPYGGFELVSGDAASVTNALAILRDPGVARQASTRAGCRNWRSLVARVWGYQQEARPIASPIGGNWPERLLLAEPGTEIQSEDGRCMVLVTRQCQIWARMVLNSASPRSATSA